MSDCEGVSGFDECVKLLLAGDHLALCLGEQSDAKGLPGLQEEELLECSGAFCRETVRQQARPLSCLNGRTPITADVFT